MLRLFCAYAAFFGVLSALILLMRRFVCARCALSFGVDCAFMWRSFCALSRRPVFAYVAVSLRSFCIPLALILRSYSRKAHSSFFLRDDSVLARRLLCAYAAFFRRAFCSHSCTHSVSFSIQEALILRSFCAHSVFTLRSFCAYAALILRLFVFDSVYMRFFVGALFHPTLIRRHSALTRGSFCAHAALILWSVDSAFIPHLFIAVLHSCGALSAIFVHSLCAHAALILWTDGQFATPRIRHFYISLPCQEFATLTYCGILFISHGGEFPTTWNLSKWREWRISKGANCGELAN